jgi:hypothetical protein
VELEKKNKNGRPESFRVFPLPERKKALEEKKSCYYCKSFERDEYSFMMICRRYDFGLVLGFNRDLFTEDNHYAKLCVCNSFLKKDVEINE